MVFRVYLAYRLCCAFGLEQRTSAAVVKKGNQLLQPVKRHALRAVAQGLQYGGPTGRTGSQLELARQTQHGKELTYEIACGGTSGLWLTTFACCRP